MRGLNDRDKIYLLKNFLRDWKCDLVCLQEMKLENVQLSHIRSIWGNHSVGFAALNAIGSTGGILVMWDENTGHLVSSSCGDFSFTCIFQIVDET